MFRRVLKVREAAGFFKHLSCFFFGIYKKAGRGVGTSLAEGFGKSPGVKNSPQAVKNLS